MLLLYNIFILAYGTILRLAAAWNPKAAEWVEGRKHVFDDIPPKLRQGRNIWMHCASAGEFEQGKPLIASLKKEFPRHQVIVTFFSPSGYRAGKKFPQADHVCFLPEDLPRHAKAFLDFFRPELVVFVKYDYWYHHLEAVSKANIPLLLVSAIFREEQAFFKWYGGLHRKMLVFFTQLFVQDGDSKKLLAGIGNYHVTVAGDTRFDRVREIAAVAKEFPLLQAFSENSEVLVAGSTWPDDERLLSEAILHNKLVIAPHEINEKNIEGLLSRFPEALRYSKADMSAIAAHSVLIIDNYGMLSSLYRYATLAYIGGGFNKSGIHNTLEAAVWGCPVIFGPQYHKFREAREMVERRAAFSITGAKELENIVSDLLAHEEALKSSGRAAADYVKENTGATDKIISFIQEKRLLTT